MSAISKFFVKLSAPAKIFFFFYFLVSFSCKASNLPKFLEDLLQDPEINHSRKNPPFFRLTTHEDREVYILGSVHNVHPKLLLSEDCFQELMNINSRSAVFFTESMGYGNPNNDPINLLNLVTETSPDLWRVEDYLRPDDQKVWNILKGDCEIQTIDDYTKILSTRHKVAKITKINAASGIALFYQKIGGKYLQLFPGFEKSLEGLNWSAKNALETGNNVVDDMVNDPNVLRKLFHSALDMFSLIFTYENENPKDAEKIIALNCKNEISKYNYDECMIQYITHFNVVFEQKKSSNIIDISTISRNIRWGDKVGTYLTSPLQNNTQPIMIVCGYGHLYGGLIKGCSSFLRVLWDKNLFKRSEIISREGKWLEYLPGRKDTKDIWETFKK